MKIHRLIMLIALIAGLPAAPLIAAEHSNELWHETRITDTTSGKFNYCAVESGFDNGLYLAFARNRDFNTNIVISFPDKRLQDHTKYRMMVGIDANPIRDLMGFAADPSILVIPLQHDRKILEWLRTGKLLDVKGPQDAVKFSLDGAAEAFKKLQQCVEQSLKDETQGVKPQAAPVPGDVARPVSEMVMPLPLPASKAVGSPSVDATVAKAIAEPVTEASAPPSPAPLVQPAPVLPPPAAPAKPVVVIADAAPQTAAAVPQVAVPVPPAPKFVPAPAATVSAAPAPAAPVISAPAAMPSAPVAPPVPASSAGMIALPAAETGTAHLSVPALLGKTGLTISGKCTDKSQDCKWSGGTLPGSVVQKKLGSDFLDAMMDDVDRHEKDCRGQFTSAIGAPVASRGVTMAEATLTCRADTAAVSDVMLYAGAGNTLVVVRQSAPEARLGDAVATRSKLESHLPEATNYQ